KVGNRIALIEQLHLPKIALAKGIEANSSTLWSEVQGIVEQIGQRLTQQKALTRYPHAGLQVHLQLQPGRLDARPLGLDQLFDQLQQTDLAALLQPLTLLDYRQVQQALDQLLHARALVADVADEALTLRRRHVFLEQFGRTANRRQRAFQFVSQGMH